MAGEKTDFCILIVGDLIIDQTWLVGEPNPSEKYVAHFDVLPRDLTDPNRKTSAAGGIGTIARTLVATLEKSSIGKYSYKINVYGIWGKDFERSKELYIPPEPDGKTLEKINFVQIAETESTRLISRIYVHESKEAKLKLKDRFDQDIEYKVSSLKSVVWPDPTKVDLLILGDYGCGVFLNPSVKENIKKYNNVLTIIRSIDDNLIAEVPWNILTMNLYHLAKFLKSEPFDTPVIKRVSNKCSFHPILVDALQKLAKKNLIERNDSPKQDRAILLNLEKEGALILYNGTVHSILTGPEILYDSPGVWASDVLVGNVAKGLLEQKSTGEGQSISEILRHTSFVESTCLKAIEAAQLFSIKALKFDHPDDGYASDLKNWFVPRLKIIEPSNKLMVILNSEPNKIKTIIDDRQCLEKINCLLARKRIKLHQAEWYLSGFHTVDATLGEEIIRLKTQIWEYMRTEAPPRPFLSAICGPPGSGKSTLAEGLAKAVECDAICTNAAQWTSIEDLFWVCEQIRSAHMRKKVLLAFIDEVDSKVQQEYIYGKLLAPVWDGAYFLRGEERRIGKAIFLLAGSTKPWRTFSGLQEAVFRRPESLISRIVRKKEDMEDAPKLLDLVSRLSVKPIDIPKLGSDRKADIIYLVAYHFKRRFPGINAIEEGVFYLFLESELIHGPRSIVKAIESVGSLISSSTVKTEDLNMDRMVNLKLHLKMKQNISWQTKNNLIIVEQ